MKIDQVTITGADDATAISSLVDMHQIYPFVEWGILFSKNKQGTSRYPQLINAISFGQKSMPMSAHLCGGYARDIMEKGDFSFISTLPDSFQRVQINYNFDRGNLWEFAPVVEYAEKNPERAIIIQWNNSNRKWLYATVEDGLPANIHYLYDSSGGRGVSIKNIQDPLPNYTGYSGGICPDNIEEIIKGIENNETEKTVWIDMESGVRTNDKFDMEKVRDVLNAVSRHIRPELHK